MCLQNVKACPVKGTFQKEEICKCRTEAHVRSCKNGVCSCKKVPACNRYKIYPKRDECYCKKDSTFIYCIKKLSGVQKCKCRTLNEICPPNKQVAPGICYCNIQNNFWNCRNFAGKKVCTCEPKPKCETDEEVDRESCRCKIKSTKSLEDANSLRGRVIRGYGWKKCHRINPADKKSHRTCTCEPLKCYEAGKFRKSFCQCPRHTHLFCNKKTDYCKCISKVKHLYHGDYKFMGIVPVKSRIVASLKYLKLKIFVYAGPNKSKKVYRYIMVSVSNGSYYLVKRPLLKPSGMDLELSLFDDHSQNYAFIQKQVKDALKKYSKEYPWPPGAHHGHGGHGGHGSSKSNGSKKEGSGHH